jgi:peptide/nickel transport system substrate-binding protein
MGQTEENMTRHEDIRDEHLVDDLTTEASFLDSRLSRRSAMRLGLAGFAGVTAASLLAACGDDDDADDDTPAEPPATDPDDDEEDVEDVDDEDEDEDEDAPDAPEGVEGGRLTVAVAGEPNSMDQHAGSARNNEVINNNIYERLVEYDENGQFTPGLVEEWAVADDGVTWTLTTKDGVSFHDGTPFSAETVVHNFDRIVDPETRSQKAAGLLGPYGGSEALDENTVEVTMTEVYAPFVDALASHYLVAQSPTAIEEWGEDYTQHPVGTGPFMFQEWVPQSHITLVKNPDYNWAPPVFGRNGPAHLDEIHFQFITEEATRITTLETGERDLINGVPTQDYERIDDDPNYTIMDAPLLGQAPGIIINTERPPTDEFEVRRAMQFAIDQDALIEAIFYGVYERAYSVLTQYNPYYDGSVADYYRYDPDEARRILDEAGWVEGADGIREKDGQRLAVVFLVFPTGSSNLVGEFVQSQFRDVGIEVEILAQQNPANLSTAQAGEHSIRWLSWYFVDAAQLDITFHTKNIGTGWNFTRYRDPELDEMLDQARVELDEERRAQLYSDIQHFIIENALLVPLYVITEILAMRSEVQGVRLHFIGGEMMFYNAFIED